MLDAGPKTGTRVLAFPAWNLVDPDVLTWCLRTRFDAAIVRDLFELRDCFEPRAAGLTASAGHAEDHEQIEGRDDALDAAFGTPELDADAEVEFHRTMIGATRNGLLLRRGTVPRRDLSRYAEVCSAVRDRQPEAATATATILGRLSLSRQRHLDAIGPASRRGRLSARPTQASGLRDVLARVPRIASRLYRPRDTFEGARSVTELACTCPRILNSVPPPRQPPPGMC